VPVVATALTADGGESTVAEDAGFERSGTSSADLGAGSGRSIAARVPVAIVRELGGASCTRRSGSGLDVTASAAARGCSTRADGDTAGRDFVADGSSCEEASRCTGGTEGSRCTGGAGDGGTVAFWPGRSLPTGAAGVCAGPTPAVASDRAAELALGTARGR
jgi:hypothetical protein